MKKSLHIKLTNIPIKPGVYFHKNISGEIIYIGKAAILKNRVRQYFQNTKYMDKKTKVLVAEIADVDWVETESEIDALFLEAEMVKRYMPKYNILLRDDKSLIYIKIDMKNEWPSVSFTRNPSDDGVEYYGPYYNGYAIKKALRYLRKIFPYYINHPGSNPGKRKPDLYAHLGLSPVNMSSDEYKSNLRKLISYIKGNRRKIFSDLEKGMEKAASEHDFEKATTIRNKLTNLNELHRKIMFGDKEFLDISKDIALCDLMELFGLKKIPVRIEGYDVSHMSGTNVVASMIVFRNGVSDRAEYRKFKTKTNRNDDYYNIKEIMTRRLSQKNLKSWGIPDLILIDGGKGQLDVAIDASEHYDITIPFFGLVKQKEQIVLKQHGNIKPNIKKLSELNGYLETSDGYILINIPKSTHIIKLLQRIRDESHRFTSSYHTILKRNKLTVGLLDEIPGIGLKTKSKLIRRFGSLIGVKKASEQEIILAIGRSKAKVIVNYIKAL